MIDYSRYDVIISSIYDTLVLTAKSKSVNNTMFVEPLSASKSIKLTNMEMRGRLPDPHVFEIHRICFSFGGKDGNLLAANSSFELWIGHKSYIAGIIPMLQTTDFPDAPIVTCDYCESAFVGLTCPNCGAGKFKMLNVYSRNTPIYYYDVSKIPLTILQAQQFYVQFTSWVNVSDATVLCELRGKLARGIQ